MTDKRHTIKIHIAHQCIINAIITLLKIQSDKNIEIFGTILLVH